MRMTIVAVGRLRQGAERELADRYRKRIEQIGTGLGLRLSINDIPESRAGRAGARRDEEARRLLAAVPHGSVLCVLDESGLGLGSEAFAKQMDRWREEGVPDLAFVIGGADGVGPDVIEMSRLTLALGPMTWPHQLARIMLLEQIYRAATIISGHPYHRG